MTLHTALLYLAIYLKYFSSQSTSIRGFGNYALYRFMFYIALLGKLAPCGPGAILPYPVTSPSSSLSFSIFSFFPFLFMRYLSYCFLARDVMYTSRA